MTEGRILKEIATAAAQIPAAVEHQALMEDFETIVQAHQRRVYRILFLLLADREDADTLTQECFLRAYKRRADFRGEARLGTWLVRIAINLARDRLKNRRQSFWRKLLRGDDLKSQTLADRRLSPEESLLAREQVNAVWDVVKKLPVQQRTAFSLRFAEDMEIGEIANVMNLRPGTVKAHLFSAVHAVRKEIASCLQAASPQTRDQDESYG